MIDATVRRSEDAAEQRSVTGWVCKHCGRFWGDDERMARYCCATNFPCECGGRHEKSYIGCEACHQRKVSERSLVAWAKAPRKPWDGVAMLYSDVADEYFNNLDEIEEYIAENDEEGSLRTVEDMRVYICEPNRGRTFDMSEYLCDDLPEDGDCDCDDINKVVNDWIIEHGPFSWAPSMYALEVPGV